MQQNNPIQSVKTGVMRLSYRLLSIETIRYPLMQPKTRFFYTFTIREITVRLFLKPLQHGSCDAMQPCFYSMIPSQTHSTMKQIR